MPTPTATKSSSPRIALTDRGRIHAVLIELDRRWHQMTETDRAEARRLLGLLAATYLA